MNEFDSYKNDFGFEIGSGFSGNSDYMKALDEKKRRALMEEQYNFLQCQYLQPIITQYFIDNKSEIWLLFLIAHSKR